MYIWKIESLLTNAALKCGSLAACALTKNAYLHVTMWNKVLHPGLCASEALLLSLQSSILSSAAVKALDRSYRSEQDQVGIERMQSSYEQ